MPGLSSALVRDHGEDLVTCCKAWRVRNAAGRYAKDQFTTGFPAGRANLRERIQVEHALAHVGRWQGRRARYIGTRKNLSGLRHVAVVLNLHVIARQQTAESGGYELAA
jgi:hypothetical protein